MVLTQLYDLSNFTSAETLADLVVVANDATNQIFMGGYLIAFFIIIIMTLLIKFRFDESLFAGAFACFFISLFLRQAQLINFTFVLAFLIVIALSGFYMYMKKS